VAVRQPRAGAAVVATAAERATATLAPSVAGTVAPDHRPLTSLFGGGLPAPAPKQEPPAATQTRRKPQTLEEYRQMEEQRHAARVQEIARSRGASAAKSEEDLQREQMEQQKKSRDRGGGISR